MECDPDWTKTLRRASFRGVPFWVESDDIAYGRRIETHEFPNRDRPFQEDLGEKAIEFNVTAYIAGPDVLAIKTALVNACRRRGAGTLVLPTEGSQRVVCFDCERSHKQDKLGYIAFSLHMGEAGTSFGIGSLPVLARLVGMAVGYAIPSLKSEFMRTYNVVGEASWVLNSSVTTMQAAIALIDDVRLSTQLKPEGGAVLAKAIVGAYDAANVMAYDGQGIRSQSQVFIDVTRQEPRGDFVDTIAGIMSTLRLQSVSQAEAIEALSSVAEFEPIENAVGEGITAKVEMGNTAAIGSLVRRLALMELAVAASEATYADRRSAIRARVTIAQGLEREMSSAVGELYQRLNEIRGRAAEAISQKIANIRPTVTVEGQTAEPSIVWAYRLYADARRGDELARRNRVQHPAFMPASFEAEAPEVADVPKRLP